MFSGIAYVYICRIDENPLMHGLFTCSICFTVLFLCIVAFVSIIFQLVDLDNEQPNAITANLPNNYPSADQDTLIIGDGIEHTMWFMQVSDTHLSVYFDQTRKPDLMRLCTEVIDIVKPSLVLATGDLTDARSRILGSHQNEQEWKMYQDVIRDSNVTKKVPWLDIRGNHDTFNVFSPDNERDYFMRYSVQGPHHKSHYNYTLKAGGDQFTFIAVDACLKPGPKPPFNLFGVLHARDIDILERMKLSAQESGSNMTLWFGHYPTSSLAVPAKRGLRDIINGPYLCGHYHMTGMYATHKSGSLLAELADWRAKRIYRVSAVDHGLFSFADVRLDEWPVIVLTNPIPAAYSMPNFEPTFRMNRSTHIRALIFSNSEIASVHVRIGDGNWTTMRRLNETLPIFVSNWSPSDYQLGLHQIEIRAADQAGNERTLKSQFSLDGSRPPYPAILKNRVRNDLIFLLKCICFTVVFILVAPLLGLRLWDTFSNGRRLRLKPARARLDKLLAKLYLLAVNNRLFLPAIGIPLYATFGPWFYGELVDGHYGWCFLFGIYIEGTWLPGGSQYILVNLMFIMVHAPLIVTFGHIAHIRYNNLLAGQTKLRLLRVRNFVFIFILLLHTLVSLIYANAYGPLSWMLGLLNTWSIAVYSWMWYSASCARLEHFGGAKHIELPIPLDETKQEDQ